MQRYTFMLAAAAVATSCTASSVHDTQPQRAQDQDMTQNRNLAEFLDPDTDLCNNGTDEEPDLGPCVESRFPTCNNKQTRCFHRKPSRDRFHPDIHQPFYYIDYDRVVCMDEKQTQCTSCTPGRYCAAEQRCIMEHLDYPCPQWF
uniref:Uncharacterized protein n=1 Tax=Craspedostauros australis TaxID=1486917 RepID=A0A7R9WR19_9STRA|mmetsp:Transcript_16856/g.46570  ORF Transcript_16856/g.46570 Transcript_16856/m.46570 type:complete len:145 (+) Transcript_16856:312-746(+)